MGARGSGMLRVAPSSTATGTAHNRVAHRIAASAVRRGDLVVCGETPGLMIDDQLVIHVCEKLGRVTVEPLHCIGGALERRRVAV